MRQNAFLYSASGPSRWLRRAAALVDQELAALCRVHRQHQPLASMLGTPAYVRAPAAVRSVCDRGRFRR